MTANVSMQGQFSTKTEKQLSKQKKTNTNSVSGGLWVTQADVNWHAYA